MKPKQKESIDFHVESDDYFVTLGTVLFLLEQELGVGDGAIEITRVQLKEIKEDLLYLQKYFRIVSRVESEQ